MKNKRQYRDNDIRSIALIEAGESQGRYSSKTWRDVEDKIDKFYSETFKKQQDDNPDEIGKVKKNEDHGKKGKVKDVKVNIPESTAQKEPRYLT